MRLFFAIPLPGEIQRVLAGLRSDLGKARWVQEEQLHLTLRFLGEVDEATLEGIALAVRGARSREPWPRLDAMRVRGVGLFGSTSRPRVLWAAVEPDAAIRTIAVALEACAVEAGLAPEARPFSAHVTLARFTRADPPRVRAFLKERASFTTELFSVPEVVLYRSTLGPKGATHEVLDRFAL